MLVADPQITWIVEIYSGDLGTLRDGCTSSPAFSTIRKRAGPINVAEVALTSEDITSPCRYTCVCSVRYSASSMEQSSSDKSSRISFV